MSIISKNVRLRLLKPYYGMQNCAILYRCLDKPENMQKEEENVFETFCNGIKCIMLKRLLVALNYSRAKKKKNAKTSRARSFICNWEKNSLVLRIYDAHLPEICLK